MKSRSRRGGAGRRPEPRRTASTARERYEWSTIWAEGHAAHLAAGHPAVRFAYLGSAPLLKPDRFGEMVARKRGVDGTSTTDPAEAAAFLGIAADGIGPPPR
jgi:hypothetical protein